MFYESRLKLTYFNKIFIEKSGIYDTAYTRVKENGKRERDKYMIKLRVTYRVKFRIIG